jgi:ssDNA-binding Zn-finger/Zn-ribbon topoisomerase 1
MNVVHRDEIVKCPNCRANINLKVGRYPGGVNDSGGWVLRCSVCASVFPLTVKNPDDASSVLSGATIIGSWDDEINNRADILVEHGVADTGNAVERMLLVTHGEPEDFYDLESQALYRCATCREELDAKAYEALSEHLVSINSAFGTYLNFYLANSGGGAPEGISASIETACACGRTHKARFYRNFAESFSERPADYWLIDVAPLAPVPEDGKTLDVDGIFSRDDCIAILEKLLLRWQAGHSAVLLAAPFIGFNFPGAKKKIPNLWNWVLKYTNPAKTLLITRKATFNLLKEVAKDTETDVEFLKSWGFLNPMLATLDEKKAFFKTDFHAKFYCGISADTVEILVGSFNIHEGSYVENIHLLSYSLEEFSRRYLVGMKMFFNLTPLSKRRSVLEIFADNEGGFRCKEISYWSSIFSEPSERYGQVPS